MLVDDFLRDSADLSASKAACVCDGGRVTYGDLQTQSNRLAHALMDAGVKPGDRVGVFLENRVETVVSIFGILKAGAAFVVIHSSTKPDKLCYMLNDCGVSGVILPGKAKPAITAMESDVPSVKFLITCGSEPDSDTAPVKTRIDFARVVETFPADPPPRVCIDMDISAIVYTSGSTGRPKGVTAVHSGMTSVTRSITQYLENVPEDIILSVLPLSFTYGLYQLLAVVAVGATLVLERSFAYPYQILQRVKQEKITGIPGVPTNWALILQMSSLDPADFDSVRYLTNAGAAMPPAYIGRLRKVFRNARIFLMHGLTECVRTTYLPPEEVEHRPTSVGRGMPNEQLFVLDEAGNPVEPGQVGELVVRGANVMKGYWGNPDETARVLRPGKYPREKVLYTGDLFTVDDEGYLYFVSRKDDIIKSRGEKVSPLEVEHVISELPDVQEVAVLGVPDEILGQAVKALVVKAQGAVLTAKDILGHCTRRLESFMVPKYIEFCDTLPKTDSGKIRRASLKENA